jgi:hypothetical protein
VAAVNILQRALEDLGFLDMHDEDTSVKVAYGGTTEVRWWISS